MAEELEENLEPEWRMNPNGIEPMDSILYMRSIKYPSVQEQLDMLFHLGYEGWKSKIQEIKNKYPKSLSDETQQ